jgi:hypothetical protein
MLNKFTYNNPISGYEVKFIPLERRMVDRRAHTQARQPFLPGWSKKGAVSGAGGTRARATHRISWRMLQWLR